MVRFFLYIVVSFFLCVPAWSQSTVSVRTGEHGGYSRIVFDWTSAAPYSVKEDGDAIEISFDKIAGIDSAAVNVGDDPRIKKVEQLSDADKNLRVKIVMASDMTVRHFTVGDRVVVDVLSKNRPKKTQTASSSSSKTKKKKVVEKKVSNSAPVNPEIETKKEKVAKREEETEKKVVKEESIQEKTAIEEAIPDVEAHVVTLSLTEALGVAVFRRDRALWIVADRPDVVVPPEITGPTPEIFSPFQRYEIKGGVAFKTDLPKSVEPLNIYGEGGGLVWRIVITPVDRAVESIEMQRSFLRNQIVRGGTATWGMQEISEILKVPDQGVGDVLHVVTVKNAAQFGGPRKEFVDFVMLESPVGIAVNPKADDLDVKITEKGIEVMRPDGLALSSTKDVSRRLMREEVAESVIDQLVSEGDQIRRIFDFDRWMMGGLQALDQNMRILMAGTVVKDKSGRVQDLLTLAKMSLSNDRGQEALGFLTYAANELPDVQNGAEYKALRGAAYALSGKYELAMQDLRSPSLKDYTELDYWRAFTLAWLEDWQQAQETLPEDYSVLVRYPKALLEKMGLKLAEISLRDGDVTTAEAILAVLQRDRATLNSWTIAGMDYLKGEAHRQSGEYEQAEELWSALSTGADDLHRAKAGLALTILQEQTGTLTREDAIDRLEGLRYAWRGDELETQINFMLGRMYLDDKRYMKGFTILRDTASMSPESDIGKEVTAYMAEAFQSLLIEDNDLSPLDAVTVYEEFTELTPTGDEGNRLVQRLAERLVEADLLGRAAGILQHQIDYRIKDDERARVATRLGAIYLLANIPRKAMSSLDTARSFYTRQDSAAAKKSVYKIDLMKARALSQMDQTEEALELLNTFDPTPDVNRLRADIAWQAGLWEDAAEALQDMILDEALDLNRPLTAKQADLILNRAVALNLSGNRVALINMSKRYGESMQRTARAKLFDVVTRSRKSTLLTDRETLESIVEEVDIFKDFLESYRNSDISN